MTEFSLSLVVLGLELDLAGSRQYASGFVMLTFIVLVLAEREREYSCLTMRADR